MSEDINIIRVIYSCFLTYKRNTSCKNQISDCTDPYTTVIPAQLTIKD